MNNDLISLIFFGDLKYCPYLQRYTERLDLLGKKYEVLFWNRIGEKISLPNNYIFYEEKSDLTKSKINKIFDFINARKWFIERLKTSKPRKIILLSTLTGIFLFDYIISNNIMYIFDIRDYSYENIKLFFFFEKKLIKRSFFTAISSKGFQAFLPKHHYVIAHNFNRVELKHKRNFVKKEIGSPINIVWNGAMRFFEFQKIYLEALKNDSRFKIIYHGDGPELDKYKKFCHQNNFRNVSFTGSYQNTSKHLLLKDADIINNAYGYIKDSGSKLKYAVSNRFYDGLIYHIPQLVEPEGYKTDLIKKRRIGTNLSLDNNFADRLFYYYININEKEFNNNCENLLKEILFEDKYFIKKVDDFIRED